MRRTLLMAFVALFPLSACAEEQPQSYTSQQECESATGKTCDFAMCDYVPEGQTYEEVCGSVAKGWVPKTYNAPINSEEPAEENNHAD